MRWVFWILLLLLGGFAALEWITFPEVARLRDDPPEVTAFMKRRQRELLRDGKSDVIDYHWVPYHRISPYFRRAILVSEDNSFYEHQGVDVEELKESLRKDWEEKRFSRGGSTITQQLAKNLYLSPSKNPYRKLKELLIARELERELTKRRILELYMNVVELGERTYGVEAASHHYFEKPAGALTPRQAALLAGALPNPRLMNPAEPNKRLLARQRIILSRMRRWGHLVETQILKPKPKPDAPKPEPLPDPIDAPPTIDTSVPEMEPETVTAEPPLPDTTATPTTTAEPPPVRIYN